MRKIKISVKNLSKNFDKKIVLNKLNLDIYESESLSIIGESGSGKSILTRCIVGLINYNDGIIEWSKSYGGNGSESGRKIIETNDNCYLIVGSSDSFGSGDNDAYLIKIDSQGNQLWSETYGGGGTDHGRFVMQTVDQGYIISGYSDSIGESNNFDFWLFKVDPLGVIEWQRSYNSDGNDRAFSGMQTLDGGYAIAGYGSLNSTTPPDLKIIKTDDQGLTN